MTRIANGVINFEPLKNNSGAARCRQIIRNLKARLVKILILIAPLGRNGQKMSKNGCFSETIFWGRDTENFTLGKFLQVMKVFIVLNWWSVMGTNGDIRVLSLANALTGQEEWEN
jgi:hypothetical protein